MVSDRLRCNLLRRDVSLFAQITTTKSNYFHLSYHIWIKVGKWNDVVGSMWLVAEMCEREYEETSKKRTGLGTT